MPILANGGGPDRVRTDDLLDANQALSQLSYGPSYRRPNTLVKDCTSVFKNRIDTSIGSVDLSSLLKVTLLRKEVIQPQVVLQLPCYDFTTNLILAGVAFSSFATSLTSFLMLRSTSEVRRALGWLLGGASQAGWTAILAILPYIISRFYYFVS